MLEEQKRIRSRIYDLEVERDKINIEIADLRKRRLAYMLAEGRGK